MDVLRFIVAALATWRITSLLLREKGPFDVFVWFRTIVGGIRGLEALTTCHWCLSIWVAMGATLLTFTEGWVVLIPFALSAVSVGIDQHV